MSNLGDAQHRLKLLDEGMGFSATVNNIHGYGHFSTGWIGYDFLYEVPKVVIECQSDFGKIQLESGFYNIRDSGFADIIESYHNVNYLGVSTAVIALS